MRIKVEPGKIVHLDTTRTASTKGGEYDLDELEIGAADRERLLATDGVSELKTDNPAETEE